MGKLYDNDKNHQKKTEKIEIQEMSFKDMKKEYHFHL